MTNVRLIENGFGSDEVIIRHNGIKNFIVDVLTKAAVIVMLFLRSQTCDNI